MSEPTTVVSIRGLDPSVWLADGRHVYIGRAMPRLGWRASIWGNPWKVGGRYPLGGAPLTPTAALLLYQLETLRVGTPGGSLLLHRIGELRGKMLGCFCGSYPENPDLLCHGVILAKLCNALEVPHAR
jgi:hypothetical protein